MVFIQFQSRGGSDIDYVLTRKPAPYNASLKVPLTAWVTRAEVFAALGWSYSVLSGLVLSWLMCLWEWERLRCHGHP